jgi:hypothetical protein
MGSGRVKNADSRQKFGWRAGLWGYYHGDTMDSMKIAISVPDAVFKAGEHLAQQLRISRSQLYADALSAYLSERGSAAVTARLNAVHANPAKLDPAFAVARAAVLADEAW